MATVMSLITDITLPAAAAETSRPWLATRWTGTPRSLPRRWCVAGPGRPLASGGIPVRLAVVPRERMQALMQQLQALGVSADRVVAAAIPGSS
ncbi:MAG: hypothetical protein U5L11_00435 [Arhodomonas sp.]|nr:hypothetical protein [Arhodomonas sp.]